MNTFILARQVITFWYLCRHLAELKLSEGKWRQKGGNQINFFFPQEKGKNEGKVVIVYNNDYIVSEYVFESFEIANVALKSESVVFLRTAFWRCREEEPQPGDI